MKLRSQRRNTGALSFCAVTTIVSFFVSLSSFAAAPNWWSERGVLVSNATADDYALVNQGQLKNLAAAAAATMDTSLAGGAGNSIDNLLNEWATPNALRNDFAPINLGQLKNTAKPFYDRLIAAGMLSSYPWTGSSNSPDDYAIANIGQVKNLFSFELNIFGDRIATGGSSASLAIESATALWSWGAQPGDGSNRARSYPLPLTTISNVISVSAGPQHAAVLKSDGTVWTWGRNDTGALGDGTTVDRAVPTMVPNLTSAIAVKAGGFHTLALLNDGTVLAWGEDYYGQLGDGQRDDLSAPVIVMGLSGVRKIAAGDQRSVALKQDGTVWTWGFDYYDWYNGQDHYQLTPTLVNGLTDVIDIAAGIDHVVAVKSDGTVWAWGTSWNNELGVGEWSGQYHSSPVQVPGLPAIVSVASKGDHTLALASDGTVWAWGSNSHGQLGDGAPSGHGGPVQVSNLSNVIAISAAWAYSMAMEADGSVWAWGQSSSALGQTMDGSSTLTPHQSALGVVDQNNNGMDDRWEEDYFGNLTQAATSDFDGDGISNFSEYQGNTDPTDYYNGSAPALYVVSGDGQTAEPGAFFAQPLTVRVANAQDQPFSNAPVTFSNGDGMLSLTNDGTALQSSLTARSNADGLVVVYFQAPWIANYSTNIVATSGSVSVQFTATTTTLSPPSTPQDLTVTEQSDGSEVVSWTAAPGSQQQFIIKARRPDDTWNTVGTVPAGTTTVVVPPDSTAGSYTVSATNFIDTAVSEESSPPSPRYAVIDLGTSEAPRLIANNNTVLIGYDKRWIAGQLQTIDGSMFDMSNDGTAVGSIRVQTQETYGPLYDPNQVWSSRTVLRDRAVIWPAGQSTPVLLSAAQLAYAVTPPSASADYPTYRGIMTGSAATAIDDDGSVFGSAIPSDGYQQTDPFIQPDGYFANRWGLFGTGWDWTNDRPLGTMSMSFTGADYAVTGENRTIRKARNGTHIGDRSWQFSSYDGWCIFCTPVAQFSSQTVNGADVDFWPFTLNSKGNVLGTDIQGYFFLDVSNQTRTHFRIAGGWQYALALNSRQLATVDANGSPIMKDAPQVVGAYNGVPCLWEQRAVGAPFHGTSLNQLVAPNSGWDIQDAYDINDAGVIAADGWYQATDSNGNPTGPRQWRSVLLWPMKTAYVLLGASGASSPDYEGDPNVVFNSLIEYLNTVQYNGDPAVLQFLRTFDGPHSGATCTFVKGSSPDSELVRVFTYNCVRADAATGAVAMQAMKEALSTPGAYVTFNGHANMGEGPAFTLDVGGLNGFLHISARGIAAINALEFSGEGYNFSLRPYVPGDPGNEVLETTTNYMVPFFGLERFPNNNGVEVGRQFQLLVEGPTAYHYAYTSTDDIDTAPETRNYTLVRSGLSDVPTLRYKWFFFDGCNTGRDYIENFEHNSFFYTTDFYGNTSSTEQFVKAIVEGKQERETVDAINESDRDHPFVRCFQFQ